MKSEEILPTLDMEAYIPPSQEPHPATETAQRAAQAQGQALQQMTVELSQQHDDMLQQRKLAAADTMASLQNVIPGSSLSFMDSLNQGAVTKVITNAR